MNPRVPPDDDAESDDRRDTVCSSFVNWALIKSGRKGTNSAAARSWLDWGIGLRDVREGAITVIKKKNATSDVRTGSTSGFHVAFYIS
jgi:hypothetical protein